MCRKQRPPAVGEPRYLGACHRHQGLCVGVGRELVEHVEPLPHRLPENLAQDVVHLVAFLPEWPCRDRGGDPGHAPSSSRMGPANPLWSRGAPIGPAVTVNGTS